MESSPSPKCGYALHFFVSDISLISDYILCTDCHLVLRDPLTVTPCGHKYCSPCYRRIKSRATERNEPFCCLIDKEIIIEANVVEDPVLKTAIDNLTVSCYYSKFGCEWQGDVSEIPLHQSCCQYKHQEEKESQSIEEYKINTANRIKKMAGQIRRCEDLITEKDTEIMELKCSNAELESQLQRLRVLFEEEKMKNSVLFDGFKNQLRVMKKEIGKNRMALANVKVEEEDAIVID